MFRRVFPAVAAPARAALLTSWSSSSAAPSAFSTLAASTGSSSLSATSSSPLMTLASLLLRPRGRSFASDAPAAGDAAQHKAPHGWGQTRVAELLESKVREETRGNGRRDRSFSCPKCPCHRRPYFLA